MCDPTHMLNLFPAENEQAEDEILHEHWALRPRFLTIPHIFSLQFLSVQQLRSGGGI